jgi:ribonuclease HI
VGCSARHTQILGPSIRLQRIQRRQRRIRQRDSVCSGQSHRQVRACSQSLLYDVVDRWVKLHSGTHAYEGARAAARRDLEKGLS